MSDEVLRICIHNQSLLHHKYHNHHLMVVVVGVVDVAVLLFVVLVVGLPLPLVVAAAAALRTVATKTERVPFEHIAAIGVRPSSRAIKQLMKESLFAESGLLCW